jgi:hypothetical protein
MCQQPGLHRFGGALRQQVHRPTGGDVDQHGPVDPSLAQGEIVDPEHLRTRRNGDVRESADPAQQRVATDCDP